MPRTSTEPAWIAAPVTTGCSLSRTRRSITRAANTPRLRRPNPPAQAATIPRGLRSRPKAIAANATLTERTGAHSGVAPTASAELPAMPRSPATSGRPGTSLIAASAARMHSANHGGTRPVRGAEFHRSASTRFRGSSNRVPCPGTPEWRFTGAQTCPGARARRPRRNRPVACIR